MSEGELNSLLTAFLKSDSVSSSSFIFDAPADATGLNQPFQTLFILWSSQDIKNLPPTSLTLQVSIRYYLPELFFFVFIMSCKVWGVIKYFVDEADFDLMTALSHV